MGFVHSGRQSRIVLLCGAILGATAVLLGAWGTHGLRGALDPEAHRSFMVAVRYQLIHAVLITGLGWAGTPGRMSRAIATCLIAGTALFSGSIYTLLFTEGMGWLGPVTPLGGTLLIVGWLLIAYRAAAQLFRRTR